MGKLLAKGQSHMLPGQSKMALLIKRGMSNVLNTNRKPGMGNTLVIPHLTMGQKSRSNTPW